MSHKPRRKRRAHKKKKSTDDLTKVDRVFEELRQIQWQTNCSSQTLQVFLDALVGNLGRLVSETDGDLPAKVTYADKKMQQMVFCTNNDKHAIAFLLTNNIYFKHRLGEKKLSCTDALAAIKKSGDQRTLQLFVIFVKAIGTTDKANPRSILSTSR